MSPDTRIAPLTAKEVARRTELETTIEHGQKTFLEVGAALLEVRDSRLYRDMYSTFEDYCQTKWNLGRRYSNQLIEAAQVVNDLPPEVGAMAPKTERAARALAKVPKPARVKVLKAASEDGTKPVTAKKITETAKSFAPPPIIPKSNTEPPRLDQFGHLISKEIIPAWDRAEAWAKDALALVSDLRTSMKAFDTDAIFAELPQTLQATINSLYTNLKHVKPHTVCPRHEAKCKLCNGRGFISKSRYENSIGPDAREKWEAKRAAA